MTPSTTMLDGGMRSVAMRSVTAGAAVAAVVDGLAASAGLAVAKIAMPSAARIPMPCIVLFFPFLYNGTFWNN